MSSINRALRDSQLSVINQCKSNLIFGLCKIFLKKNHHEGEIKKNNYQK